MRNSGTVKWFNDSRALALSPGKAVRMCLCTTAPFKAMATAPWQKNSR